MLSLQIDVDHCVIAEGPLEPSAAFFCTHASQLENNVTLPIMKRESNDGGVYYNGKANRCSSRVHILHSREGQEVTWVWSDMLSYGACSGAERICPVESVTLQGDN